MFKIIMCILRKNQVISSIMIFLFIMCRCMGKNCAIVTEVRIHLFIFIMIELHARMMFDVTMLAGSVDWWRSFLFEYSQGVCGESMDGIDDSGFGILLASFFSSFFGAQWLSVEKSETEKVTTTTASFSYLTVFSSILSMMLLFTIALFQKNR